MSIREQIRWRDIEGIRVGLFGGRVNTTVILWRLGSTIIDTGPPNQWASVRRFVEERPVAQVLATHHHEDHAGNLARFPAIGIDRILAPEESLAYLRDGFPLQLYRRIVWGRPQRFEPGPFEAFVHLPEGGALEPILLPGHSTDMTCLLDRERGALFGADVYVGSRLRYLREDEDLSSLIGSLEHILRFDFDTLLCSHRGVVQPAREKLHEKLDYLLDLRGRARALSQQGIELEEIVRRLLGPEDHLNRLSNGHFSKRNLILGCLDANRETGSDSLDA